MTGTGQPESAGDNLRCFSGLLKRPACLQRISLNLPGKNIAALLKPERIKKCGVNHE